MIRIIITGTGRRVAARDPAELVRVLATLGVSLPDPDLYKRQLNQRLIKVGVEPIPTETAEHFVQALKDRGLIEEVQ